MQDILSSNIFLLLLTNYAYYLISERVQSKERIEIMMYIRYGNATAIPLHHILSATRMVRTSLKVKAIEEKNVRR